MSTNTSAIFPLTPNIGGMSNSAITAANTNLDGTGTLLTVFTGGANGSFLSNLVVKPLGSNVQSVLRIFLADASSHIRLIGEMTLPATTASANSQVAELIYTLNRFIPSGWTVQVCLGTAVAGGYVVTGFGGDY